ncbi:hypothetical protein AWT69_001865 [Pseudomonas putida]|nr:hypothetical protein AWT69_001865 [Pseudomonas putida]
MFSDSQAFGRAHIIHEKRARVGWLTKGRASIQQTVGPVGAALCRERAAQQPQQY